MGISYLNDIVIQNKHTEASQILNSLRKRVKSSLQQNKADVGSRDGMDMAFCMINNETNEVNFAGAYNPLYIFRNNELINLKADKMPIGVHKKERDFLNQKFQLLKGDCLYMFSDGFIDQFGGPDGKKYLRKRFNEFLQDIHNLPMTEQRSLLLKEHINWKGNYSQIDDILVIGLKI